MDKRPINKPKSTSSSNRGNDDDVKIYKANTTAHKASPPNRKPGPRKKKKETKTWLRVVKIAALSFLIIGLFATVFVFRYVMKLAEELPEWDKSSMVGELTTIFYDAQGNPIAERHGVENRAPVSLDKVPQDLINGFLATEDHAFYSHFGISIKGIVRSSLVNLREKRFAQGASTITQMLARNALIDKDERYEKKWNRKIKEVLLALQLENQYEKNEILEMFLNTIAFGQGAYGVQAASETFFNKDVSDLTLEESALLAGLPQRPSAYNPFRNPESALGRRSQVLLNMEVNGYISTAQKDIANQKPLNLGPEPLEIVKGPYLYFIDYAMTEAERVLEENGYSPDIYRSGYRIYTTMNTLGQDTLETLFKDPSNFPNDMSDTQVQAAMVLLDHKTGRIQAMMGGREYVSQRGFNRATSTSMDRQPGSVIKPITVYGPALELGGMSPATMIDDSPFAISTPQGPYEPTNYDGRYRGPVSIRDAIRSSINVPAIKVLNQIGTVVGYDFARKLDFPLGEAEKHNLAIALGGTTHGNNPLELARAYGAFANEGVLVDSYSVERIETNDGTLIYEAAPQKKIVMSEETAFLISDMLQTVVQSGTGTNAKIAGWQTAGKTGTTQLPLSTPAERKMFSGLNGNKDAWFAGYTTQYTATVWMGFDETNRDHYLRREFGGKYPAQLFKQLLTPLHATLDPVKFTRPNGVVSITIDKRTGLLPSPLTPADYIGTELFDRKNVPTEISDVWKEVIVCGDTGLLATHYCPTRVSKVFLSNKKDGGSSSLVSESAVEAALKHFGVTSAQELPAEAIKRLVRNSIPEDASNSAPTDYCMVHSVSSPDGSGINSGYWQYFPKRYQPTGYLPPVAPPEGVGPDDPLEPPIPDEPTTPVEPDKPTPGGDEPPTKDDIYHTISLSGTEVGAKLEWNLKKDAQKLEWTFTILKQTNNNSPTSLGSTQEMELIDSQVEPNNTYYYTIRAENKTNDQVYQSAPVKIIY